MTTTPIKVKKTYTEVFDFINEAEAFLKAQKEKKGDKETKLCFALNKMIGEANTRKKGLLSEIITEYYEKVDELRVEHSSVDKDGNIVRDSAKELMFTKAKDKELKLALKELNKKEIEFKPYFATEINEKHLSDYQKDIFLGFIIPLDHVFSNETQESSPD